MVAALWSRAHRSIASEKALQARRLFRLHGSSATFRGPQRRGGETSRPKTSNPFRRRLFRTEWPGFSGSPLRDRKERRELGTFQISLRQNVGAVRALGSGKRINQTPATRNLHCVGDVLLVGEH